MPEAFCFLERIKMGLNLFSVTTARKLRAKSKNRRQEKFVHLLVSFCCRSGAKLCMLLPSTSSRVISSGCSVKASTCTPSSWWRSCRASCCSSAAVLSDGVSISYVLIRDHICDQTPTGETPSAAKQKADQFHFFSTLWCSDGVQLDSVLHLLKKFWNISVRPFPIVKLKLLKLSNPSFRPGLERELQ